MQFLTVLLLATCSILTSAQRKYHHTNQESGSKAALSGVFTRTTGKHVTRRQWPRRRLRQQPQHATQTWRNVKEMNTAPTTEGRCQDTASQRICINNLNRVRREGATCFKDAPMTELRKKEFWRKRYHQIRYIQRLLKEMCCATCVRHELNHLQKIRERNSQRRVQLIRTRTTKQPKVVEETRRLQPFPEISAAARRTDRDTPRSGVYYIFTKRIYLK